MLQGLQLRRSADASLLVAGILMNPANPKSEEEGELFFYPGAHCDDLN